MLGQGSVSIVRQAGDRVASEAPVSWAIDRLRLALEAGGTSVEVLDREPAGDGAGLTIHVTGSRTAAARGSLVGAEVPIPDAPEAFALAPARRGGRPDLLAIASDARGLVYAVLELADRVEHAADPLLALRLDEAVVERPVNAVRSMARCFTSERYDLPWFLDEGFWRRYLSMLVAQRFNRISLTLGLGYNFPWHVTDAYFYFAYPFLVDVPGFRVRVSGVDDEERQRNLEMLRFASSEAAARGLDFQLGLWTHAYEWLDSPDAVHTVEGLTLERHAAYCRDALQALLGACPSISGVTLRIHGESGIPERSWDFWRTMLDGVVRSRRRVGIDLHAKGLDRRMLEMALSTGLPVTVSPKYAAEHMGLPYHQAALRELDRPPVDEARLGAGKGRFMTVSEGSRPFTRYSYGDFLTEDRPYGVVFRIWPGTQRLLLWGDPSMAAGFGRHAGLAGSQGLEWFEPLTFRGREGSALGGRRDGYADASLSSPDDWEKFAYSFSLLGRLSYDPAADPECWRRSLRAAYGPAAKAAEAALASASRILPLVTSVHHPSASNNYYWPEIYTDIAIAAPDGSVATHYYDTPAPKRFGTVGPLDPEVFSGVEESVREALAGEPSGRYSPLDVARWLEELSGGAAAQLARMEREVPLPASRASRRLVVDVGIQEAIGRFFAGKLRAAVFYELFTRTGRQQAIREALRHYRMARSAWAEAAARGFAAYAGDLTFGPQPWLRGTWPDRLPAIDADLEAIAGLARSRKPDPPGAGPEMERAVALITHGPGGVAVTHRPPAAFRRGEPIPIELGVEGAAAGEIAGVSLRYRRLDQSETYRQVEMHPEARRWVAAVPAGYADSPYPVQYRFVLCGRGGSVWLHPGLGPDLDGQPYFVVRQRPMA
jgi:hypothetical protein